MPRTLTFVLALITLVSTPSLQAGPRWGYDANRDVGKPTVRHHYNLNPPVQEHIEEIRAIRAFMTCASRSNSFIDFGDERIEIPLGQQELARCKRRLQKFYFDRGDVRIAVNMPQSFGDDADWRPLSLRTAWTRIQRESQSLVYAIEGRTPWPPTQHAIFAMWANNLREVSCLRTEAMWRAATGQPPTSMRKEWAIIAEYVADGGSFPCSEEHLPLPTPVAQTLR